jgi:hypothetical protein
LFHEKELERDYIDDKEKKWLFLEKIIALTSVVLNKKINVSSVHILAGKEPEKTNSLLQGRFHNKIFF